MLNKIKIDGNDSQIITQDKNVNTIQFVKLILSISFNDRRHNINPAATLPIYCLTSEE